MKFTNGSVDYDLVAGLYSDFVREALGSVSHLVFGQLEWGDGEARQLADVLPLCPRLESLSLGGNHIGDEGAYALANRLPANLKQLDLSYNVLGRPGLAALMAGVPMSLCVCNVDQNKARCPVADARTRAKVEQLRRFFRGERAAVTAEVTAERSASRTAARTGPPRMVIDGQEVSRRLHCTGRREPRISDWPALLARAYECGFYGTCCCCCRKSAAVVFVHWLDPYRGEWLLSDDEPLCEGAPHYERRLRSGATVHLFRYVEPASHDSFWQLGPALGSPTSTAETSAATDSMTPTQVPTWSVREGEAYKDDQGFAFVEMQMVPAALKVKHGFHAAAKSPESMAMQREMSPMSVDLPCRIPHTQRVLDS